MLIAIDDSDMPLLYARRDQSAVKAPRFGCGLGHRGACTVQDDGHTVRTCVAAVSSSR